LSKTPYFMDKTWDRARRSSCRCQQCEKKWIPQTDERPKRCPRCSSWNWDRPKMTRVQRTCLRCGKTWNSKTERPKKCPYCQSFQWDLVPVREYTYQCKRCLHPWKSTESEGPRRCPGCQSTLWTLSQKEYPTWNRRPVGVTKRLEARNMERKRKLQQKGAVFEEIPGLTHEERDQPVPPRRKRGSAQRPHPKRNRKSDAAS